MNRAEAIAYLGTLPEDEPVFVLRAQGKLAPQIVQRWIYCAAEKLGWSSPKVIQAEEVAQAMQAWPTKKYPD
jgi:hypothetical protein